MSKLEVLCFGERGKQRLKRYDQRGHLFMDENGQVFDYDGRGGMAVHFPRGHHSAKPLMFYEFLESISPGPYVELFARRREPDLFETGGAREGWFRWGKQS